MTRNVMIDYAHSQTYGISTRVGLGRV